jgi:hypothetical protein
MYILTNLILLAGKKLELSEPMAAATRDRHTQIEIDMMPPSTHRCPSLDPCLKYELQDLPGLFYLFYYQPVQDHLYIYLIYQLKKSQSKCSAKGPIGRLSTVHVH